MSKFESVFDDPSAIWQATQTEHRREWKNSEGNVIASVTVLLQQRVAFDRRHSIPEDQSWTWSIHMPSACLNMSGGRFESAEKAMEAADRVMPHVLALAEARFGFARYEIGTDKVDMFDVHSQICLLCGHSASVKHGTCLHSDDDVRNAFALALRLGHQPRETRDR